MNCDETFNAGICYVTDAYKRVCRFNEELHADLERNRGGRMSTAEIGEYVLPPHSAYQRLHDENAQLRKLVRDYHRFADAMCEAFGNQKGFALDRVLFLNRGKSSGRGQVRPSEMCVSYPDGYDVKQLTGDGRMTIFQRWKDRDKVMYISDLKGSPQVWELDTSTGTRRQKWSLKGSPDGIAVSPDGTKVAAILTVHGNPELYVISGDRFVRLTNTPLASEGQPAWSPDGKKIAYVSNEARNPQIFVVDVATKAKRRLTSKGRENVDPDWGPDGRIAYITKRGGAQVAVMSPAEGDATAELVTPEGNWEHPTWSRDMRHLAASRDRAVFIIDTLKDGDKPRQLFGGAEGNFISPVWQR